MIKLTMVALAIFYTIVDLTIIAFTIFRLCEQWFWVKTNNILEKNFWIKIFNIVKQMMGFLFPLFCILLTIPFYYYLSNVRIFPAIVWKFVLVFYIFHIAYAFIKACKINFENEYEILESFKNYPLVLKKLKFFIFIFFFLPVLYPLFLLAFFYKN